MIKIVLCLAIAVFLIGPDSTGAAGAVIDAQQDFNVEFTNCVESIGVGLVPTEPVQSLLPAGVHLVGEGQPVTPLVVRTADCGGIAVAGQRGKAGSIVQIGVVIVPPDFTGDINNYTLWYYTSNAKLAQHLKELGIDAQIVSIIDYDYEPAGSGNPSSLHIAIGQPGSPRLRLDGVVVESAILAGSFEANWWVKAGDRIVKMNTVVPQIFIGGANLGLMTDANSDLGLLIGGPAMGFPVIEQFNTFSNAQMRVSVIAP